MSFEKVAQIRTKQSEIFVARNIEILGVWLTLLTGEHGFFFGLPGIAKTMLVQDTVRHFPDFEFFDTLMSKTTVPENLYGPVSITGLRQDKFEHATQGFLPTADVAFLDEGFKASGTILNTLLRIMNERTFHNGTNVLKVPLQSLFVASNEIPTDSELNALYDRILFRFHVKPLQTAKDFARLLQSERAIREYRDSPPAVTLTTDEYRGLRSTVNAVEIPHALLKDIVGIRDALMLEHQIQVSDRRWLWSLKGVRAHAALYGREEATQEDLAALSYMLWGQPHEIDPINAIVWGIANPIYFLAQDLKDDITKLLGDLQRSQAQAVGDSSKLILGQYAPLLEEVQTRIITARDQFNPEQKDRFGATFDYMADAVKSARVMLTMANGGLDPKAINFTPVPWEPERV